MLQKWEFKETPENSFFNLEINKEEKTTVNESFETKIYNIERKENQLIIYSNTLNIKVTDVFTDSGIPLYNYRESLINPVYIKTINLSGTYN